MKCIDIYKCYHAISYTLYHSNEVKHINALKKYRDISKNNSRWVPFTETILKLSMRPLQMQILTTTATTKWRERWNTMKVECARKKLCTTDMDTHTRNKREQREEKKHLKAIERKKEDQNGMEETTNSKIKERLIYSFRDAASCRYIWSYVCSLNVQFQA